MFHLGRSITAALLAVSLAYTVGCQGLDRQMATVDDLPISSRLQVPDLNVLPGPGQLSAAQLQEGLRQYLNAGQGAVSARLEALYGRWQLKPPLNTTLIQEADLDGDGVPEVITALNDTSSALGSGTIFVIYRKDGRYEVDRSLDTVLGAGLYTTADITGDGRREIIWSSSSAGANTVMNTIFVSAWAPGRVEQLTDKIEVSYGTVEVSDRDLIITGGLKGGWGAGRAQRARVDRYTWRDSALHLIDQRFTASDFSYHRLQDGILAQQGNSTPEAAQAFQDAMERERPTLAIEDTVPAEWEERFDAAVRTMARFRLGLLYLEERAITEAGAVLETADGPYAGLVETLRAAPTYEQGCAAAATWAEHHPEFLEALNIPRGYANPQWAPTDLCGPLPPM